MARWNLWRAAGRRAASAPPGARPAWGGARRRARPGAGVLGPPWRSLPPAGGLWSAPSGPAPPRPPPGAGAAQRRDTRRRGQAEAQAPRPSTGPDRPQAPGGCHRPRDPYPVTRAVPAARVRSEPVAHPRCAMVRSSRHLGVHRRGRAAVVGHGAWGQFSSTGGTDTVGRQRGESWRAVALRWLGTRLWATIAQHRQPSITWSALPVEEAWA